MNKIHLRNAWSAFKQFDLKKWIRSKYMHGYGQPTPEEIEAFLLAHFKNPTGQRGEKIYYMKPYELHALIDENFRIKTDKRINVQVFRKLNFSLIKKRDYITRAAYDAVPLVIINPVKTNA